MFILIHSSPSILLQYRCLRRDQSTIAAASGLRFHWKEKERSGPNCTSEVLRLNIRVRIARILKNELDARSSKYTHFELKNVVLKENKFPLLV